MNKLVLSIAAVAAVSVANISAAHCHRHHCADREVIVEQATTVAYSGGVGFVESPNSMRTAPECYKPCIVYEKVPAVREVSYYCPDVCLNGKPAVMEHGQKMEAMHREQNIAVDVRA